MNSNIHQMRVGSVSALPAVGTRPPPEDSRRDLFDLSCNIGLYAAGIFTGAMLMGIVEANQAREKTNAAVMELAHSIQKGYVLLPVVRPKE